MANIIPLFSYLICCMSGVLITIVAVKTDEKLAFLVYLVVSISSIFILPTKNVAFIYIFFIGYYPIVRLFLEKIKFKFLTIAIKTIIFLTISIICNIIFLFVFEIKTKNFFLEFKIGVFVLFFSIMVYDNFLVTFIKRYYSVLEERIFRFLR